MNLSQFDLANAKPMQAHTSDSLPAGDYIVEIIDAHEEEDRYEQGKMLLLVVLRVTDGPYQNRRHWQRFHLNSEYDKKRGMALSGLSALTRAVGVNNPQDSSEVCGIPLSVTIEQKPKKDNDGFYPVIVEYRPISGHPVDEARVAAAFSSFPNKGKPSAQPASRPAVQPAIAPPKRQQWAPKQGAPPYQPVAAKTNDDMEAADLPF